MAPREHTPVIDAGRRRPICNNPAGCAVIASIVIFTIGGQTSRLDDFTTRPLVQGPYLSSDGHTGVLEIRYPGRDSPLRLDFHNPVHAIRSGTPACPQWYEDLTLV